MTALIIAVIGGLDYIVLAGQSDALGRLGNLGKYICLAGTLAYLLGGK